MRSPSVNTSTHSLHRNAAVPIAVPKEHPDLFREIEPHAFAATDVSFSNGLRWLITEALSKVRLQKDHSLCEALQVFAARYFYDPSSIDSVNRVVHGVNQGFSTDPNESELCDHTIYVIDFLVDHSESIGHVVCMRLCLCLRIVENAISCGSTKLANGMSLQ
jgi:hypothetical protein